MSTKEECKHGLGFTVRSCGLCRAEIARLSIPSSEKRHTNKKKSPEKLVTPRVGSRGFTMVKAQRGDSSLLDIDERTTSVHIIGHPYVWLLQEIFRRGPNVVQIQAIPTFEDRVTEHHRSLCSYHGIALMFGHGEPERAWAGSGVRRSDRYHKDRRYLLCLSSDQQVLLDELLEYGFEEALMLQAYYSLADSAVIVLSDLSDTYGFSGSYISRKIGSVLHYLDSSFRKGKEARAEAERLGRRVVRIRRILSETEAVRVLLRKMGLSILPAGMPASQLDMLENIANAYQSGCLELLRRTHPHLHETLCLRFGLHDVDAPQFRFARDIGKFFGVTPQAVYGRLSRAFKILNRGL